MHFNRGVEYAVGDDVVVIDPGYSRECHPFGPNLTRVTAQLPRR